MLTPRQHPDPSSSQEGILSRLKRMLLLLALGLLTSVLYIDHTSVNLALPHITYHLKTSLTISQWLISAFDLAWAFAVIPAGFFADIISKRRICLLGMLIFALASLVAGSAENIISLIGARIFQGIGTGLYVPTLYGIIRLYFHESHHSRAIGSLCLWTGLGMSLGPFLGGFFLKFISWHSIFIINIPICLFCGLVIFLTKDKEQETFHIYPHTPLHLLFFTLFMFSGAFFLTNLAVEGSHLSQHFVLFSMTLLLMAIFIFYEKRSSIPLFTKELRKNRTFILSSLWIFLEQIGYTSCLFVIFLYLQIACQLNLLQCALLFLFLTTSFSIYAILMGRILYKRDYLKINFFAFTILVAGSFLFSVMPVGVNIWLLLSLLILGVGMGVAFSSLESAMVRFVPNTSATFAASLFLMISLVGNTLGVVLTTSGYTWLLKNALQPLSRQSGIPFEKLMESATNVSLTHTHDLPHGIMAALSHICAQALQNIMTVTVAVYALAFISCILFVRAGHHPSHDSAPHDGM